MKITKLVHSCLLIEMPERTALFDPGAMSGKAIENAELKYLDDIIITHEHGDHMDLNIIKSLVEMFPDVRIKASSSATKLLHDAGIDATQDEVDGVELFDSKHEPVEPLFPTPDQIGVHYLKSLTHPGDSLGFVESMQILALPLTAPWGATVDATNLAIKLKPRYVIPIHDWHWNNQAREQMYDLLESKLGEKGITFIKAADNVPFTVKV